MSKSFYARFVAGGRLTSSEKKKVLDIGRTIFDIPYVGNSGLLAKAVELREAAIFANSSITSLRPSAIGSAAKHAVILAKSC